MLLVHSHPSSLTNQPVVVSSSTVSVSFENAAAIVLSRLQEAVTGLLAGAPGPTGKCTDIEKTFGIDAKLAWHLLRISTATNPLAVGTNVPARVSVQRLLKAALKRKVPTGIVEEVKHAFEAFEFFVQQYAEDRTALEDMIAAHLPESREKAELASKQAQFKAMRQIRGVEMDTGVQTFFLSPVADRSVELAYIEGYFGLKRIKPGSRIGFSSATGQPDAPPRTLSGELFSGPSAALLPQFCSDPLPKVEFEDIAGATYHLVVGQDIGLRGAVDLVSAWRPGEKGRRFRTPEVSHTAAICVIDTPVKRLICDVFVHKDLYPHSLPELRIYQLGMHGMLRAFSHQARDGDRLDMHESVRSMGHGIQGARVPQMPRYVQLLEHVYKQLGWDAMAYRGYRLDVHYPVYGAQYNVGFELPTADQVKD
jgi:hypothetical protein